MEVVINKDSLVKCPWCGRTGTAETWNETTLGECRSREMKRAFKPIYLHQVWGKASQNFYKCPSCNSWSRGNELELIDSDGNKVKGLGGKQVLKLVDRREYD